MLMQQPGLLFADDWFNSLAVMPTKPHNRSLTSADKRAAAKLKAFWKSLPREERPTQLAMAQDWPDEKGTQSLISQYLNGDIALNYKALLFFSQQLGCAPEDIRKDLPEQKMGLNAASSSDEASWSNILGFRKDGSMGEGAINEEYAETHKLKFRADSLRRQGLRADKLAVIYGKGDSMTPTINDGDAILFDTSDTDPKDEKLYVVTYDGKEYVKRLIKLGDRWFIESDNKSDPAWKRPRPVDEAKEFIVHGRVRWIGSWTN